MSAFAIRADIRSEAVRYARPSSAVSRIYFFILSLDIPSSFFIESLDMLSFDMVSFFIESFDMLSLDMVSFFISSARAAGASGAMASPDATSAVSSMLFFIRLSSVIEVALPSYHGLRTRPHQFPVAASWHSAHGFVRMTGRTRPNEGVNL